MLARGENAMSKHCAFCSFATDDDARFAEHAATVHGWGPAPRTRPRAVEREIESHYCYACAQANPLDAVSCRICGAQLWLAPSGVRFGKIYLLNQLPELRERGLISAAGADLLERQLMSELGIRPAVSETVLPPHAPATAAAEAVAERVSRVDRPTVAPRPPKPPSPGLLSPERAPSLLLYVGAFLIVVAALIFVGVSGEQIGGGTKLVMLIIGTVAFIAVGLACHRSSRVREAGRTFTAIGAVLVPVDFGAYYLLISGQAFAFDVVWTAGWLVSAALYAVLAATGYGRLYAYLFLPSAIATVGGLESISAMGTAWTPLPEAALCMAVVLAATLHVPAPVRLVLDPIARAANVLANAFLVVGLALAPGDRPELTAALALTGAYHAWRAPRGTEWERWIAALAPGALLLSLVYVAEAPAQTYGFVLALLAVGYGLAGDALGLGTPIAMPAWLQARDERIAAAALVLALVPQTAYWRAPLTGSIVHVAMAACLFAVAALRPVARARLVPALVLGGALVAHGAALFVALASGLIDAGAVPFTGLAGRDVALAFVPVAVLLGAASAYARTRIAALVPHLALAALLSAVAVVVLASDDHPLATVLAAAAALGAVGASVLERRHRLLWIALGFAAASAIALDRWLLPPLEARPLALAAASLVLFLPAYRSRFERSAFGRTVREIALVVAGAAVATGFTAAAATRVPLGTSLVTLPVWLATVPAVVTFGILGVAEGLRRRSEEAIVGSTAFFPAAVLMLVARLEPDPIEAYGVPTAAYLALVAYGLSRWRARLDGVLGTPARVGAAVALVVPSYAWSWSDDDARRAVFVLGASIAILRFAAARADAPLAWSALAFLVAALLRALEAPLAFETATALFGGLLLALALAVPRFVAWRLDARSLEATEAVASLLVLAPPLGRAVARGPDALDHGAAVLALGVVVVALALWRARRSALAVALAMLALVALLALPESSRAEPYVAAAGVALIVLALLIPRVLPRVLPLSHERALQATGAVLLLSGSADRTFVAGGDAAWRLVVECLALVLLGLIARREMLASAGTAGAALIALWIAEDPRAREFHGLVTGAALITLALAAARSVPRLLDARALLAMETGGALLFIAPTLIASWAEPFLPRTPMVMLEILIVLAVGVALHRRWLVAAAVVALGLETMRGLVDAVNRLPNYVLFAATGALLLAAGFVLLLKREAWRAWSERVLAWWTRL